MYTAITNATPFIRLGNKNYTPSDEWKSLSQWCGIFNQIVLLKPEITSDKVPEGWVQIPGNIFVQRLCTHAASFLRRKNETKRAMRIIANDISILYCRMPNYEGYWCYKVAKEKNIPLLLELHGDWETAIFNEDFQGLLRKITRPFRAIMARHAVCTMAEKAKCVLSIGPALREKYIPKAVPTLLSTNHLLRESDYQPRTDNALKDPPRILFVGALQRRKGLHILFSALELLRISQPRFELLIVGDGTQQHELQDLAKRKGISDHIRFIGKIAHGEALFNYYKNADLFVLPSIAAEGVPRVIHEAMAFGCPVLATDNGSVRWQLQDGAGIVVPPNNPLELKNAIERILQNDDLRRYLSERGYKKSLQYSLEKQTESISKFIKSIFPN